jgi:hypothetical protein
VSITVWQAMIPDLSIGVKINLIYPNILRKSTFVLHFKLNIPMAGHIKITIIITVISSITK